ncbi:uncharacterized protein [Mytilus edulis]|uniref:uncharacterized protein n=1 Tax=Mytilus edulis TaxID=6550 RepID=UPI0039EDEEA7
MKKYAKSALHVNDHQLCQSEPVNVQQFQEESQSDEELFNLDDDDLNIESTDPPQNADDEQDEENIVTVPAQKRFKSCFEIELDKISQARNEKNTYKQTQWGVQLFRGWLQENDHNLQFENLEESTLNERLHVFFMEASEQNKDENIQSLHS